MHEDHETPEDLSARRGIHAHRWRAGSRSRPHRGVGKRAQEIRNVPPRVACTRRNVFTLESTIQFGPMSSV